MAGPLTENVSFEVASTYFSGWQIRATQKRKCFDSLGASQFLSLKQLLKKNSWNLVHLIIWAWQHYKVVAFETLSRKSESLPMMFDLRSWPR